MFSRFVVDFIKSIAQGHGMRPREILPPVKTLCFNHFTVEKQIDTRIKRCGDSKANYLQRVPYSKRALMEEEHNVHVRCF